VLPRLNWKQDPATGGTRSQDVALDRIERHREYRGGRGRGKTEENGMRSRIARAQTRGTLAARCRRPMVVVRRRTVMMVTVMVTGVRVHVSHRGPHEGPDQDDGDAGDERPAHAESLSQHCLAASREEAEAEQIRPRRHHFGPRVPLERQVPRSSASDFGRAPLGHARTTHCGIGGADPWPYDARASDSSPLPSRASRLSSPLVFAAAAAAAELAIPAHLGR
jgi:hypothetical protein